MNLEKKGIIGQVSLIGSEILKKFDSNDMMKVGANVR